MAAGQLVEAVRQLRRIVEKEDVAGMPDADLVRRYVRHRDATAFEVLVQRHGPLVLSVCRRVLRNSHDAEDAFQATFLVPGQLVDRETLRNAERNLAALHGTITVINATDECEFRDILVTVRETGPASGDRTLERHR
jgi:hypothetical protein